MASKGEMKLNQVPRSSSGYIRNEEGMKISKTRQDALNYLN
jgi:hypothetical protein